MPQRDIDILNTEVENFIHDCLPFLDIPLFVFENNIKNAIGYYNKDKSLSKDQLRGPQKLKTLWFKSLKKNQPDYSIYLSDIFLSEAWACWVIYSRRYLKALMSPKSLFGKSIIKDIGRVQSIVDLGCGVGYTTAALKQLFPKAKVYGTNIKGSKQWLLASKVSKRYNFSLTPNMVIRKQIDLVFASEYFEHFENAVEHLEAILDINKPKALIIANSFGTESVGHFIEYTYKEGKYSGKQISRIFNNVLRQRGYKKIKTALWNNRPSYWRKDK